MHEHIELAALGARVADWLAAQGLGCTPPLEVWLLTGGRSNLTFGLRDQAGGRWVLRRPPLEAALASAHDVLREWRIVAALGPTGLPCAPALAASAGAGVLGAPFALYGFVEGAVLHDSSAAGALSPAERHALGLHVVDVLAALHQIDPDAVGLGDLGPRAGYIERQVRRWSKQWAAQSPRRLPAWEAVRDQLSAAPPQAQRLSIVHGDYRLGNLIVAGGRVAAVLDWELCALGDPLADLAYLANNWLAPGQAELWASAPTKAGGFPPLAELLARYAAHTGLDLAELDRYRAFAQWRLAAILEGVRLRDLAGGRSDAATDAALAANVDALAHDAQALLG